MRTIHLRNVPDEVVERLERLAARDRMSVAAVALRELEEAALCGQPGAASRPSGARPRSGLSCL
jgi:plasmid stability protein